MNDAMPERLQELLDRGIDPLDDPGARQWLTDHPEALERFAGLRADLLTLRSVAPAAGRRGWLRRLPIAAAVLVAAIAWLLREPEPVPPSPLPRPDFSTAARIVDFTTTTTVQGSDRPGSAGSYHRVLAGGNATAFRRVRYVVHPAPEEHLPFQTTSVMHEENVLQ